MQQSGRQRHCGEAAEDINQELAVLFVQPSLQSLAWQRVEQMIFCATRCHSQLQWPLAHILSCGLDGKLQRHYKRPADCGYCACRMCDGVHSKPYLSPCRTLDCCPLYRSEVSAGEAAIAQLERDLAAAQAQLAAAQAKVTAAQEDAAEKEKIIKYAFLFWSVPGLLQGVHFNGIMPRAVFGGPAPSEVRLVCDTGAACADLRCV